jgi:branched-chain amino acid transport system substrate-binding protein
MVKLAAMTVSLILVAAACGSSSKKTSGATTGDTSGNTASAPGVTATEVNVSLVTTNTGVAAPNFKGLDVAFKARIDAQNAAGGVNGRQIKVSVEDDASSPNGNLTASQKAVQTDNPFIVVNVSAFTTGGYRYILDQKIPIIGGGFDGPEWAQTGNESMISIGGNVGPGNPTSSVLAQFMKDQGVTKVAGLGYSVSQSSSAAAKKFVDVAAPAVGMTGAYTNTSIPFGGTNVGPIILDMKKAGVDGVYLPMDNNTNYGVVNSAEQNGLNFKAAVMATGYGQELLDQPTTLATAEGKPVFMAVAGTPVELNTTATKKYQADLAKYGSYTGVPGFQYYEGYVTADLFIQGLIKAGKNPTRQGLVDAIRAMGTYDGAGLNCSPVDVSAAGFGKTDYTKESCSYLVKIVGGKFVLAAKVTGKFIQGSADK